MAQTTGHHEFGASFEEIETSSDRSFGLVFTAFFGLLAAYFAWHRNKWLPAPLALSTAFIIVTLTRPALLAPLNWAWTRLGLLLGAVMAPVVMGIIFFGVVTPIGLLARLVGKDFLRLRRDPRAVTYWREPEHREPTPESLRDQF